MRLSSQSNSASSIIGELNFHRSWSMLTLDVLVGQVIGVILVALSWIWMKHHHGGFSWDVSTVFNYHPFFMTLGLVFFNSQGVLIYKTIRSNNKFYMKLIHGGIQIMAFLFTVIGLVAVFDSHNKPAKPIPNMYSLHSWLGIAAVILFGLQWSAGFITFLYPRLGDSIRSRYLPYHRFWGLGIFVLCCATSLTGMTEKAFFAMPNGLYSKLPGEAVLINMFGLLLAIFAFLVVYSATKPDTNSDLIFKDYHAM